MSTSTNDRTNTDFVNTFNFSETEELLKSEFGEKFASYRVDYNESLNYDKGGKIPKFPLTVSFELINRCNLKCIMCYTDNHGGIKHSLEMGTIDKVLGECEKNNVPAAVIGMGSEALLYKNAKDVIQKAREAGIMDIFFSTNAVLLDEETSEFLVDQKVARIEISLDSATPETYVKIRARDKLEIVEENIRKLVEIKKKKNSKLPVIRLCYCVQEENKHENELFLEKWKDLVDYVDFQELIDFGQVGNLINKDYKQVGDLKQYEVKSTHCAYPFNSLHVWANGDITPCCTFYGKALPLGNVKDTTLEEVWNGKKLEGIRNGLLNNKLHPVCRVCLAERDKSLYKDIKTPEKS